MKLRRASGWYATVLREMGRMGLELPGTVEELAEFEWVEEMVGKMHDWEENASRTRAISNDLLPFLHPVNFPPSTSLQHLYYISNQSHQQTLLRFISGHSDLRVVVLGRTRREEEKVPRRERVCRHGCGEIEDEAHLMRCEHAGIVALRAVMLEQAKEVGWDENERRGADEEDGNRGNDELGDMDEVFLLSSLLREPKCASFVISEPYAYDPFTITNSPSFRMRVDSSLSPPEPPFQPSHRPSRSISSSSSPNPGEHGRSSRSKSSTRRFLLHPSHPRSSTFRPREPTSVEQYQGSDADDSNSTLAEDVGEPEEEGEGSSKRKRMAAGGRRRVRSAATQAFGHSAQQERYDRFFEKLNPVVRHFLGWREKEGVSTGRSRAWLSILNRVSPEVESYLLAFVASAVAISSVLLLFSKTDFLQRSHFEADEKVVIMGSMGETRSPTRRPFTASLPLLTIPPPLSSQRYPHLGASIVLLYSLPFSPASQPRSVLLGHLVSSLIGCSVSRLFTLAGPSHYNLYLTTSYPDGGSIVWIAGGLATSLALVAKVCRLIFTFETSVFALSLLFLPSHLLLLFILHSFQATKSVHPPGGATALLSSSSKGVAKLGFLLVPIVLISALILTLNGLVLINLTRLHYPTFWWTAPSPVPPAPPLPEHDPPTHPSNIHSIPLRLFPHSDTRRAARSPGARSSSQNRWAYPEADEVDEGSDWLDAETDERFGGDRAVARSVELARIQEGVDERPVRGRTISRSSTMVNT
ncbi:hypothetical protein BDY24DRAFT_371770 [Mrakia frigida]|uniref:HPP family protein n=1 Tax=Mrakia frigida TaxID=29902 RepID=UPI003FCBF57E